MITAIKSHHGLHIVRALPNMPHNMTHTANGAPYEIQVCGAMRAQSVCLPAACSHPAYSSKSACLHLSAAPNPIKCTAGFVPTLHGNPMHVVELWQYLRFAYLTLNNTGTVIRPSSTHSFGCSSATAAAGHHHCHTAIQYAPRTHVTAYAVKIHIALTAWQTQSELCMRSHGAY